MNRPPFDASPEAQAAVARALAEGIATAGRYNLDLTPYDVLELEPRAALIQLSFALRTLFTWEDVSRPATAAPDVEAIADAVKAARDLRHNDTLGDLLKALRRYDSAVPA